MGNYWVQLFLYLNVDIYLTGNDEKIVSMEKPMNEFRLN